MPMFRRFAVASLALAVLALTGPARAQAPSNLRWKFKEGQTIRYVLSQKTNSSISVGGQSLDNAFEQEFEMTWKVKAVRADGSAEMSQVFDRVKYGMDSVLGQVAVDTKDEKDPEGPAAMLGGVFRALVGADSTMVMTALGEIKELKLPAKATEALKNVPQLPGGPRTLSEDSFKDIIQQATLVLPEKALAVDATWTSKREVPQAQLGTMVTDTTYTFRGPDAQEKGLDKIDVKSVMDLKVNPDAPFTAKMNKQDSQGTVLFNREAGQVVRSKVEQKFELGIEAMGQQIDSETKSTITITLRDEAKSN